MADPARPPDLAAVSSAVAAAAGTGVLGARGEVSVREPTPLERTVARRTAEARATIPDLELTLEVEVPASLAGSGSLDGPLLAACASALRSVPQANGAYRDGRFEAYSRVNIGFVVADRDTYLIPTVFDADERSPVELNAEVERLAAAGRERSLTQPAFAGATFTLWNAGALGLTRASMVINPPQAAALAAGAVREVAVVREGRVTAGHALTLTLACDHRVLYGAAAAEFLHAVGAALRQGR